VLPATRQWWESRLYPQPKQVFDEYPRKLGLNRLNRHITQCTCPVSWYSSVSCYLGGGGMDSSRVFHSRDFHSCSPQAFSTPAFSTLAGSSRVSTPVISTFPLSFQWRFYHSKRRGYFGANANVGERLKVYIRSSLFTVVNLNELWSNYPRSIWHVIRLVCEKWGQPGDKPKFWGPWPHDIRPVETPLSTPVFPLSRFPLLRFQRHQTEISATPPYGPAWLGEDFTLFRTSSSLSVTL